MRGRKVEAGTGIGRDRREVQRVRKLNRHVTEGNGELP